MKQGKADPNHVCRDNSGLLKLGIVFIVLAISSISNDRIGLVGLYYVDLSRSFIKSKDMTITACAWKLPKVFNANLS